MAYTDQNLDLLINFELLSFWVTSQETIWIRIVQDLDFHYTNKLLIMTWAFSGVTYNFGVLFDTNNI
jgi:hypothetical protein